ncbi:MAG: HIT family hydrolase [Deltaproteobacteria bacterium]|nr:HIT domain-containing protein [Deltaproteobacteria bacterium]RLA91596.1 MAG: HIT family hydrolase [Deltaproteobacteria bacterium]
MKRLWAPWRMEYILKEKDDVCIFCESFAEKKDRETLILFRGESSFIIMNRYPYNNGHLMVAPIRHIANLEDLSEKEKASIFSLIQLSIVCLKKALKPEGFNIGMNLGRIAGAGIEDHLHFHIVPRWAGDTNFMPVLSEVRVMPQLLQESYDQLYNVFHEQAER